ncbi:MAG: hypothetical protein IPI23_21200 [Bacteroidetes bacterium]|nr:hypothetical protein [Bacteroidota bacterium]
MDTLLKQFTQLGNTAQNLTLTGTAVASFNGSTFYGEITVSSPGILLKNSTFNGMSSFTKPDPRTPSQMGVMSSMALLPFRIRGHREESGWQR